MNWIITFINGKTLEITDEEYRSVIAGEGFFTFKRTGNSFNKSSISTIESLSDYKEEQKSKDYNGKIGILHDGIRVIKHFGNWVKADDITIDSNGNARYEPCSWDYAYYPEIACDEVKTPKQYTQWLESSKIGGEEIPYLENKDSQPRLRANNGFTKVLE